MREGGIRSGHLEQTYCHPEHSKPFGYLSGLPETAPDPDVPFNTKMISWTEFEAVVRKARFKSVNLSDMLLRVKVPRAIEYIHDKTLNTNSILEFVYG